MSDNWDSEDNNEVQDSDLVKQLRKQLEAANKQLKAVADTKRGEAVNAVLAKLPEGKRDKAKKLIGETDPDEWFSEYGDLFGGSETPVTPAEAETPALPAEDVAALQAISGATQGGTTPDAESRFAQKIAEVKSPDDITRLIFQELSARGH